METGLRDVNAKLVALCSVEYRRRSGAALGPTYQYRHALYCIHHGHDNDLRTRTVIVNVVASGLVETAQPLVAYRYRRE